MTGTTRWIRVGLVVLCVTPLSGARARSDDHATTVAVARVPLAPADIERLSAAQRLAVKGESSRAESLFSAVIDGDSTRPAACMALNGIAKLRYRDKDYRGAIDALQRIDRLDPNNAETLFLIGLSYRELKENDQAVAALHRAVALFPTKAEYEFWLGMMLQQTGATGEAEAAFGRAVEADSTGTVAALASRMIGRLAYDDGRYREAVRALERAVALNAIDASSWRLLSAAYGKLGMKDKARRAASEHVGQSPIDSPLQLPPPR